MRNRVPPVILAACAVAALASVASGCAGAPAPTPAPEEDAARLAADAGLSVVPVPGGSENGGTPAPPGSAALIGGSLPDVAGVVARVSPAVVQVVATVPRTNIFGQESVGASQGSGVFFDERGYILTNNHVVDGATAVEVVLASREHIEADVVGVDPSTDLAVLRVDLEDVGEVVVAPLKPTSSMRPGEWVIAIGSPLGFQSSVTVGVVSAMGRSLDIDATTRLHDLLQTDAVINPGNSGGPLLNLQGEVIGINTAIIRGADGIGFAISMETAMPVSAQLIENGKVIRPRLGVVIQDLTSASAIERGLATHEGILVVSLAPDGPAERAGIQTDDVIVQIDDAPIATTAELVRLLLTDYEVGDVVRVTVARSAIYLTFDVTLEEVE